MLKRNCQQISELHSQSIDGKIRIVQRLQIWVHSRMCTCPVCKGFQQHLSSLRDCVRGAFVELDTRMTHVSLDDAARSRMRAALDAEQRKTPDETA